MEINIEHLPDAAVAIRSASDIPDVAVIAVSLVGAGFIIFLLFVLPIWLLLHYRSRSKHLPLPPAANAIRIASPDELAEIARMAERIEHRLDAVETLMDADTPHWKR